jgi:hypothetical protein
MDVRPSWQSISPKRSSKFTDSLTVWPQFKSLRFDICSIRWCIQIDDEPLTPEEIEALDEAAASRTHEKTTSHEEFLAELGITKEEIDNFQETPCTP